jgi:hypothetical protein
VPAREPIEDRHVHREKGAKSWPGATEKVRVCNADVQLGFGTMRIQRDLWIVLSAGPENFLFLGADICKLRDQIRPLGQSLCDQFTHGVCRLSIQMTFLWQICHFERHGWQKTDALDESYSGIALHTEAGLKVKI